jgi:hypothetical protein
MLGLCDLDDEENTIIRNVGKYLPIFAGHCTLKSNTIYSTLNFADPIKFMMNNNNNNNNLHMGRHPVAVVILHITYAWNMKVDYSRIN